jgi:hypothetical protein
MTKLSECKVAFGHLEGGDFSETGISGDWQLFEAFFPETEIYAEPPIVVATPILEDEFDIGAYPVCVVKDVTVRGFTLAARNMADHGFAAFYWMAVLQTPGTSGGVVYLTSGVLSSLYFGAKGSPNQQNGLTNLDMLNHVSASVILTATDQNVSGHTIGAVAAVADKFLENIGNIPGITARNPDIVDGSCNYNWARFDSFPTTTNNIFSEHLIETGLVPATFFQPSGICGDWNTWDINFSTPFETLPVVFLTANNVAMESSDKLVAPVGVVQSITIYGFRLAARNSDIASGKAGFNWIAIGS